MTSDDIITGHFCSQRVELKGGGGGGGYKKCMTNCVFFLHES